MFLFSPMNSPTLSPAIPFLQLKLTIARVTTQLFEHSFQVSHASVFQNFPHLLPLKLGWSSGVKLFQLPTWTLKPPFTPVAQCGGVIDVLELLASSQVQWSLGNTCLRDILPFEQMDGHTCNSKRGTWGHPQTLPYALGLGQDLSTCKCHSVKL